MSVCRNSQQITLFGKIKLTIHHTNDFMTVFIVAWVKYSGIPQMNNMMCLLSIISASWTKYTEALACSIIVVCGKAFGHLECKWHTIHCVYFLDQVQLREESLQSVSVEDSDSQTKASSLMKSMGKGNPMTMLYTKENSGWDVEVVGGKTIVL